MKTLILYVFHQDCENLQTFIKRGLINSSEKEFVFISNDPNPNFNKWQFLFEHNNVRLFIRPNIGHDFQGVNEGLYLPQSCLNKKLIYASETKNISKTFPNINDMKDDTMITDNISGEDCILGEYLYQLFDKIIIVNSTVTGPYLPLYADKDWADYFTSKLSEDVKMTGISVNFLSGKLDKYIHDIIKKNYGFDSFEHAHIQSMVYSLDVEGINILMKYGLFKKGKQFPRDKWELICSSEIGMTSILRHEHKSVFSYMINQGLIKYNDIRNTGDLWCVKDTYPLCESIFVKVNYCNTFAEKNRYDNSI